MIRNIIRALYFFAILAFVVFLGVYISNHSFDVLNPKGVIALAEKKLLITAVSLMMIVIVPVFVMLGVFSFRYREGNTRAKYAPEWHTNKALEIIWWTIPAIIIFILACITWTSTHELDPYKPIASSKPPIVIQAVALDWKWLFIYPEQGIATVNFVEFPKDTPISFRITSDAPMNAFWIPQLGGQVYAMAGMDARLHLLAHEEGDYKGLSSNFSGDGFSGMKFTARVTSDEKFEEWVRAIKVLPNALTREEYDALAQQSHNNPFAYYAMVDENLYTHIMMKYMSNQKDHSVTGTSIPTTEEMNTMHSH